MWDNNMPEPYELVAKGKELAAQGNYAAAVQSIQIGINEYERRNDAGGVTFALGRLGDCYERADEIDKARDSYEKAVQIGTDIPATYSGLIGILVTNNELDRAFEIANLWQAKSAQQMSYPAQQIFIGLGGRLARLERYQDAINVLQRTIMVLPKETYPDLYWSAQGRLGQAYEQSGDLDTAMRHYLQAITDGSSDQNTYTRFLINLEKQKQYSEALKVVHNGLRVQKDAAWEADLRKREQRLMQKSGAVPKGTPKAIIPDFAVRKGEKSISLIQQIQFSPQLSGCACVESRIYGISGGKSPKLIAHDLGKDEHTWQVELHVAADKMLAAGEYVVALTQEGSVGKGSTQIYFYHSSGRLLDQKQLPDLPTEVVMVSDKLYAGCRDGKLYAFTLMGQPLWTYSVPGSEKEPDSPYFRPCPYYVSAGEDLVAFSSFEKVFVMNSQGRLLYRWSTPEQKSSTKAELFTITFSMGPGAIRALCAPRTGNQILIASDHDVFELVDGKVVQQISLKAGVINNIALSPSGKKWAISVSDKVILFEDGKQVGSFPLQGFGRVHFNQAANRIIGWGSKTLSIATYSGTLLAEVEFVKDIQFAKCQDDGKLVVGTRYIIHMDTARPHVSATEESKSRNDIKGKPRPQNEAGIPVNWIEAEKISIGSGKSVYRGVNSEEHTIEQIALEHYESNGYRGAWTEDTYWWEIMALLFWDVIFAKLPGVFTPQFGDFPSKMQDMPRDLFTSDFYSRRRSLIEKRIQALTSPRLFGFVTITLEDELKNAYERHIGKPCRPIEDWNRHSLEELLLAIKALNQAELMTIMRRLLEDFTENRRGLPDLFMADAAGRPKFVEVKGEREKIADHQIVWLTFLQRQIGISVEICRIIS
jgi:tetratricopeptide (TPR) repeat protein